LGVDEHVVAGSSAAIKEEKEPAIVSFEARIEDAGLDGGDDDKHGREVRDLVGRHILVCESETGAVKAVSPLLLRANGREGKKGMFRGKNPKTILDGVESGEGGVDCLGGPTRG
jgi:hypothetical protein